MGSLLSRTVEIRISNNTRNITLKNPRTYFNCGHCPHSFMPELSPGSSGTCYFLGSFPFRGVAGILVYEAESFTLAIHFSNPINYSMFSMELGLELSPGKAHLGSLADTYNRMVHGTYSGSDPDTKFDCDTVGKSHGTVQVSDGSIKVTATMSNSISSRLKVVLDDHGGSGGEAGTDNPCRKRHMLEK